MVKKCTPADKILATPMICPMLYAIAMGQIITVWIVECWQMAGRSVVSRRLKRIGYAHINFSTNKAPSILYFDVGQCRLPRLRNMSEPSMTAIRVGKIQLADQ